ncbi:MAG: hypothetical protein ABW066_06775 [Sedimenticola sp.]
MSASQGFYTDAALTSVLSANLQAEQQSDGSSGMQKFRLYIGNPDSGLKIETTTNPGVDQVSLTVEDVLPASGHEATEVVLALSELGLASATPGAALDLGTVINGGVGNAVEVWIGVTDATGTIGQDLSLTVELNDCELKAI